MPGPRHVERTRVAWVDTDAGGRIHFTAAFRWAEAAETALGRSLGLLEAWSNLPRRAVEAEYLHVLRFEDEIEVELRPERVGETSVTYAWEIRRDGQVCIRGRHTAVHVDDDGRPAPLPERMRAALATGSLAPGEAEATRPRASRPGRGIIVGRCGTSCFRGWPSWPRSVSRSTAPRRPPRARRRSRSTFVRGRT